jgi:hypothetical protein
MERAALVVCLAVVLAGCNAPLGPGATSSPAPTTTPTATPAGTTAPTATPAPDPADVGLAADGVVNATALALAHDRRLTGTSYTLGEVVVVRDPNGTVVVRNRRVVRAAPGGDRFDWNGTAAVADDAPDWAAESFGGLDAVLAFSNDSTTFVQVTVDGRQERSVYSGRNEQRYFLRTGDGLTARSTVERTFSSVGTRVTAVDREGGTVLYDLAASEDPHDLALVGYPNLTTEVQSLSATVERSGLVRSLVVRYTVDTPDGRYTVRRALSVADVGTTTVDRPAWVGPADGNSSVARGADRHSGRAMTGPVAWP